VAGSPPPGDGCLVTLRIYLGTTLDGLRSLQRSGELGPSPFTAHAVTPALRESYAEADAEQLEYAALTDAALQSLRAIASSDGVPRRIVVAAEAPDEAVTPDGASRSSVTVTADVPLKKVAAIHLDDEALAGVVAAGAAALAAGDETADAVEDVQAEELMWFATQELPYLLG
jgi:hypothetical protein